MDDLELQDHCECPITMDTFKEPVILESGHTLEKSSVETMLKNGQAHPLTRKDLKDLDLKTPNLALKQFITAIAANKRAYENYEFRDSITKDIISDPVVCIGSDGESFDRSTLTKEPSKIREYLVAQKLDPDLDRAKFVTNINLKNLIEYIDKIKTKNKSIAECTNTSLADVTLSLADNLYDKNAFPEALKYYEILQNKQLNNNDRIHCLYRSGNIKSKLSKNEEAIKDFEKALDLIYQKNNGFAGKEASESISKYIKISLELNYAYRILADRKDALKYFKLSIEICDKAYNIFEKWNQHGSVFTDKAEDTRIKFTFLEDKVWAMMGLCNHTPSIIDSKEKSKLNHQIYLEKEKLDSYFYHYSNSSPEMLLKKAQYYFLCENYDGVNHACEIALNRTDEHKFEKEIRIKIRLQLALALSAHSEHAKAIEYLQAALMLEPTHRATLKAKAEAHFKLGEFRETLKCCDISLQLAPNDPPMLVCKTKAALALREYDEAQKALECILKNEDLSEGKKSDAKKILDTLKTTATTEKNTEEPSNLNTNNFISAINNNPRNLNDQQTQANADVFRQTFCKLITEKSTQLKHYVESTFDLKINEDKVSGVRLYYCVYMMQRVSTNDITRDQYESILSYIKDIQDETRKSLGIYYHEPTCSEPVQLYLTSFVSNTGPANWKLINDVRNMLSSNNGSPGKTPGGVSAQLEFNDTIDQIHIDHLKKVALMLQNDASDASENKSWKHHISQMILGNRFFPSVDEYYKAIVKIAQVNFESKDIESNANTILRSINKIEKELYDCGAIDAKTLTCFRRVTHSGNPNDATNCRLKFAASKKTQTSAVVIPISSS